MYSLMQHWVETVFLADCLLVLKLLMVVVGSLQLRRSVAAECIFPDKRFRDFQLAVGSAVCSVAQPDRAAAAARRASSLSCKGFAMVWGVGWGIEQRGRGDKMGGGVLLSVFLGMLAVGQGERCWLAKVLVEVGEQNLLVKTQLLSDWL